MMWQVHLVQTVICRRAITIVVGITAIIIILFLHSFPVRFGLGVAFVFLEARELNVTPEAQTVYRVIPPRLCNVRVCTVFSGALTVVGLVVVITDVVATSGSQKCYLRGSVQGLVGWLVHGGAGGV